MHPTLLLFSNLSVLYYDRRLRKANRLAASFDIKESIGPEHPMSLSQSITTALRKEEVTTKRRDAVPKSLAIYEKSWCQTSDTTNVV